MIRWRAHFFYDKAPALLRSNSNSALAPLDVDKAPRLALSRAEQALGALEADGKPTADVTLPFAELQAVVGFPEYYEEEEKYRLPAKPPTSFTTLDDNY